MTRKDYVALAKAINDTGSHQSVDETYREGWQGATSSVAHRIANVLGADNARFDRARFFEACGLPGAK